VADIRIGTSGWSYPTGRGTWNGVFYPQPRPHGFDELAFYATRFDFVELNTTFYGQPRAEVAQTWADRTPPGFEFSAKLYQQFTHPTLFRQRVEAQLLKALGTTPDAEPIPSSVIDALVQANQADIDAFRRGLDPLAWAGKLGPLVAQFPASFRNDAAARAHLAALLRAFAGYEVCVELRHVSWSTPETLKMLTAFGAAWLEIDEPRFKDSIRIVQGVASQPFRYLRLHGRNAKAWWKGGRDDRYNYLYSAQELQPIAESLREAKRARVAFNNHPNAQAVTNAEQLREMIASLRDVTVPVSPE
jgi:uncharacterized protein YecE (DUF72 family)